MKAVLKITKEEILVNMNKVNKRKDTELFDTDIIKAAMNEETASKANLYDKREYEEERFFLEAGNELVSMENKTYEANMRKSSLMIFVSNYEIIKTEKQLSEAINDRDEIFAINVITVETEGETYYYNYLERAFINTVYDVDIIKEKESISPKLKDMTEKISKREWNKTYVERSSKERKELREKIKKESYLQRKLHEYNKDLVDVVDSINKAFEYYSENEVKYLTEGRTDGFYLKKVDKSASKHEVVKRVINHEMLKPRDITDYDKKEELIDKGYSQEERKIIWMFQMNMINNDFKVRTIKEVLPEEKYQEIINSVNKVLKGDRVTGSEIDLLYSLKRLKKQGMDIIEQIEDLIESEHFRIRLEKAELKEFKDFKEEIESFEYKNKLKQNKKYIHRLI